MNPDAVVRKTEIPDRLIESLAAAPLLEPHEIEMWVRCGGRINNPGPRSRHPRRGQAWLTEPSKKLSKREREVLALTIKGLTQGRIAYQLGINKSSVWVALAQATFRLGASSVLQACLIAIAEGLIESPSDKARAESGLTPTERQALLLWKQGLSREAICKAMDVRSNTLHTYLRHARRKLGAPTTAEAARLISD